MKLERDFYGKVAKGNVAQKGLRKPLKVTFPKLPKKAFTCKNVVHFCYLDIMLYI